MTHTWNIEGFGLSIYLYVASLLGLATRPRYSGLSLTLTVSLSPLGLYLVGCAAGVRYSCNCD